jgi:Uma2 family endonuclease
MTLAPAPFRRPPDRRPPHFKLNVEQYHDMIERGILPEGAPYELIDGMIVAKDRSAAGENPMTVGREHTWSVTALEELNPKFRRLGCYMRIQQPLTLPPYDEPEPDGALVPGTKDNYLDHHPVRGDLLCVVEVSDSSLEYDRSVKQQIYADNDVPLYVIVNLPEGLVECYTEPIRGRRRYRNCVKLTTRQILQLPAQRGKSVRVPVSQLLPQPRGS